MNYIFKISIDGKTLLECLNKYIEHVIIPDGIIVIGDIAFSGCSSLKSIDIPNSVTIS